MLHSSSKHSQSRILGSEGYHVRVSHISVNPSCRVSKWTKSGNRPKERRFTRGISQERLHVTTFPSLPLSHAYLPQSYPHPCLINHVTFSSTVTLLFIITCRRGSSSSLSRTLTHYAYLLISGALYDTLTRCGRPFPGLSCI